MKPLDRKTLLVCLGLFGIGLAAACGKSMPSSPVSPEASIGTTASATTALVSGRVGSGSSFGYSTMSTTSGTSGTVTVTATGSPATTTADASGRFQLNVPPGSVELHFTGSGIDSRTNVGTVAAGDTVDVLVNLNGTDADLQVSDRTSGNRREIEGRVNAVPPTTASGTFRIGDRLINTNAETDFFLNGGQGSMNDVLVGTHTRVTGPAGTSGFVALDVNVQNDQAVGGSGRGGNGGGSGGSGGGTGGGGGGGGNTGNGGGSNSSNETVTGPISGVLGTCPGLNLTIGATRVHTNAQTQFELSCLGLLSANGNASATGARNADGSITATVVRR